MDNTIYYIGNAKNREEILKEFFEKATERDHLLLARYVYGYTGEVYIEDKVYDQLMLKSENDDLKNQSYEDDTLSDLVKEYIDKLYVSKVESAIDLKNYEIPEDRKIEIFKSFPPNTSMMYYSHIDEMIEQVNKEITNTLSDEERTTILTYKHDGWNITVYYDATSEYPIYAHTRGRDNAKVTECTELMKFLLPKLKTNKLVKIVGELVLKRDGYMELLQNNVGNYEWVNIRSSISTFVSGNVHKDYWKHLEFITFKVEYLDEILPLSTQYNFLKDNGFQIPLLCPVVGLENIEKSIQMMADYYTNTHSKMYECDGLAITFMEDLEKGVLVAYKGGIWGPEVLSSIVEEIIISESGTSYTPIAIVRPVQSRNNNTITRVPLINPRLVAEHGVDVGCLIEFIYQSQQNVYFSRVLIKNEGYIPQTREELMIPKEPTKPDRENYASDEDYYIAMSDYKKEMLKIEQKKIRNDAKWSG